VAATTFTWTATAASAWTIQGNWSPVGVPAAGDTAIDPSGTILVNTGTVAAADLSIGGSLTAPQPGQGSVSVTAGALAQISDAIAVWSGSTLSVDATSSVDIGTSGLGIAGDILIENGHSLVGAGLIAAPVINDGTIEALGSVASNAFAPGTLEIGGSITGAGVIDLATLGSIVQLDGSVSPTQTINFGAASELILNAPGTSFNVPITNLNTGDRIEFNFGAGVTISNASVTAPGTVTVVTNTGSYQLTNVSFAAGSSQAFFFGTDPSNGDSFIQVQPPFVNWVGTVGTDYGTPGNWQGGVVPNASDSVSFLNNPGTITGTGSALSLNIGFFNTSTIQTWTFSGATINVAGQPGPPFLPYAIGFSANTVLSNSTTLNAAGGVTSIGNQTNVTVTAQGGSHITTGGDSVGSNAGQSGSLVLTGLGTTWTEQAGPAINGSIPGFLNVGLVGPSGGLGGSSGFLTVTNGATLNTGAGAEFGGSAGSHGTGTISAGGTWNAHDVTVGQGGAGTLDVSGGTLAAAGNLQVSSNGIGTMTIDAGGTVSTGGTFSGVGINAGSDGSLQILNGGTYQSTVPAQTSPVFNIGFNGPFGATPAAIGSVSASGVGSLLNLNGNPMSVGNNGGNGSLTIAQGATVEAGTPDSNKGSALQVGRVAGGTGNVTVTDPNSLLSLSGFVLLGQAGTGTLLVQNSGSVAINNAPTNGAGFFIGSGFSGGTPNVGGSGQATITSNGHLTAAQNITIGGVGANGTLNVNNGGTVLATTGYVIANAATVGGTLYGGTGLLNIGAGGVVKVTEAPQTNSFVVEVGASSGSLAGPTTLSNGTIDVSGAGALLDTNGNAIDVGRLGNGTINVSHGGSVVAGTQDSNLIGATAIGRLGNGSLTISDAGSTYTANGFMVVGRGGTGSLTIQNQGTVVVGLDSKGFGGISFGAAQSSGTTIQTGGSGTGLITGLGYLDSKQNISVGANGATGSLTINTGGTAEAFDRVLIGNTATYAAGTTIQTTTGTTIANATTVLAGNGTIDVGAGGLLKTDGLQAAGQAGIVVGNGAGSTGSLKVNGGGATVGSGGDLIVGFSGLGSLSIGSGGTVTSSAGGGAFGAEIAAQAGSAGSNVTVDGVGSEWQISGSLLIGEAAAGTLTIASGATVTATSADLTPNATGSGNVSLTGAGSDLQTSGALIIGDKGSAQLSIGAGSTVDAVGGFSVGLSGVVTQSGGVLDPAAPNVNLGSIGGFGQVVGDIENDGSIAAAGGTYEVTGNITTGVGQHGSLIIDSGASDLMLDKGVDANQSADFLAASGTLTLEQPGSFAATVFNFAPGDTIQAIGASSGTFDTATDILTLNTGANLQFSGIYTDPAEWHVSPNGTVTLSPPCFAAGTMIATPGGNVPVERLSAGDRVLTVNGEAREIIWIGTGKVLATRGRRNAATPVIVRKSALADNVPQRDLHVTKGHSLYLDGVLIPVEFLVNHRTILWDDRAQEVTIYHIELLTHDVLLANGAPAESYRDDGNRWLFENSNAGWTMPPQAPCAPVLTGGPIVDAIWQRLLDRAGSRKGPPLTDESDLHLLVDGTRFDPIERSAERCAFRLLREPRNVRIRSRTAIPQELGVARDPRCLGVAVRRIVLAQPRRQRAIEAASASLVDGWHPFEPNDGIRWSDGDAVLPTSLFSNMSRTGMLILHTGPRTLYLDEGCPAVLAA
jgi:T5SS/PEP-CTERM-associated repeat protein